MVASGVFRVCYNVRKTCGYIRFSFNAESFIVRIFIFCNFKMSFEDNSFSKFLRVVFIALKKLKLFPLHANTFTESECANLHHNPHSLSFLF